MRETLDVGFTPRRVVVVTDNVTRTAQLKDAAEKQTLVNLGEVLGGPIYYVTSFDFVSRDNVVLTRFELTEVFSRKANENGSSLAD
jgi:hypothetical protein